MSPHQNSLRSTNSEHLKSISSIILVVLNYRLKTQTHPLTYTMNLHACFCYCQHYGSLLALILS